MISLPQKVQKFWNKDNFFLIFAFSLYIFILLSPFNLASEDLGRHLKNGENILHGNWLVLYQNYYSYTNPHEVFINHHWLSGVVFYLIEHYFQIAGLKIFNILILLVTLGFTLRNQAYNKNYLKLIFVLPIVLLLSSRIMIRPENFGYLMISFLLLTIDQIEKKQIITSKIFLMIFFMQILFVNLHISFFFTFLLLLIYLIHNLILKRKRLARQIISLLLICFLASLFNPSFLQGLLAPLTIFRKYGYTIVENKDLIFLAKFNILNPNMLLIYYVSSLFSILLNLICLKKIPIYKTIFNVAGIILAILAFRNVPLYPLLSFPTLALCFDQVSLYIKKKIYIENLKKNFYRLMFFIYLFVSLAVILGIYYPLYMYRFKNLAYMDQQFAVTQFFNQLPIEGNIFNNYDIGSFLIYSLNKSVFVDNRPEAYPEKFFQEVYIPMQIDEQIWQKQVEKYQIEAIVFSHTDITPWAQKFLKSRKNDPQWKIIYLDSFSIIFIKNLQKYQDIINKYQIN